MEYSACRQRRTLFEAALLFVQAELNTGSAALPYLVGNEAQCFDLTLAALLIRTS